MNESKVRVVIVDDEFLARQRIADLLAREPRVVVVAEAANRRDAVETIKMEKPDLVFLDVQMPQGSGIDVLTDVGVDAMPLTIFVTAYERFAVKAFELAAIDYLVKPFDDERFEQSLRRALEVLELRESGKMREQLRTLVERANEPQQSEEPAPQYIERIAVELRGQLRVVPVDRIDYITASGPYAELHVGEQTYAVRERMHTLEERLDPEIWFRIHRSAIVRLDRIDTMRRAAGGDYAVRLKNGVELSVSRNRRDELEAKLLGRAAL